jgi:hypothetical protein
VPEIARQVLDSGLRGNQIQLLHPGSPAAQCGEIQRGDEIVEVDGKQVVYFPLPSSFLSLCLLLYFFVFSPFLFFFFFFFFLVILSCSVLAGSGFGSTAAQCGEIQRGDEIVEVDRIQVSFRALAGRLKFTVRLHTFNEDFPSSKKYWLTRKACFLL